MGPGTVYVCTSSYRDDDYLYDGSYRVCSCLFKASWILNELAGTLDGCLSMSWRQQLDDDITSKRLIDIPDDPFIIEISADVQINLVPSSNCLRNTAVKLHSNAQNPKESIETITQKHG